ncbi:MAG: hypothetical protein ACODAE_07225 [Gemmatimonadota bacterium]
MAFATIRSARLAAVIALFTVHAGCGAGADRPEEPEEGASAGLGETVAAWSVSPEPDARIGGAAEDSTSLLFYEVSDAYLRGEEIVVANGGTPEVKVFAAEDGRVVRVFGGEGEGPGEFAMRAALLPLDGDSVAALDGDLRRITVFGPEGEPARTISLAALSAGVCPAGLHRCRDGTFLLATFTGSRPSDPEGVVRHSAPYLRISAGHGREPPSNRGDAARSRRARAPAAAFVWPAPRRASSPDTAPAACRGGVRAVA